MNRPFFSIVVPCFNQAHFLPDCLDSVINQDFDSWEVILIDDGSTDKTFEVGTSYAQIDSRIKVTYKINGGLSSARNVGLESCNGDVLLFLDADDMLLPGCLTLVETKLSNDNRIDILQTGYAYMNERNRSIIYKVSPALSVNYQESILFSNLGPVLSIFIRRRIVDAIGRFDESLKSAEDWDFWMRAIKAGAKVDSIPNVTGGYRYVENSMSRNAFQMYDALKEVALRAPKRDLRIKVDSALNIERDIDVKLIIKRILLTCLGVSVLQGKVRESVQLLNEEKVKFALSFEVHDYALMYSYLTFRYWTDASSVRKIFTDYYPNFVLFFESVGLAKRAQNKALYSVFSSVHKIRNRIRYGKYLGGLINFLNSKLILYLC